MGSGGGDDPVAHVVGRGEDQLGALRHHVVDDSLDRGVRAVGGVDLVEHDERILGQAELLDDVLAGLVVRL